MNDVFEKSIMLIGGMSIGKSSVSKVLNKQLGLDIISSDAVRCEVLESDSDYTFEKQLKIREENGYIGEMKYLMPYSNIALNKIIDNLNVPCIIDVGAIFKEQLDDDLITKIKHFKNIILLYSEDLDSILKRRNIDSNSEIGKIYIETLNNPIYELLATNKICVDGKTVEEIYNEIINIISDELGGSYGI